MKHKTVLALLALVVAASGCVGGNNNIEQAPADTDSTPSPYVETSTFDYWSFENQEIDRDTKIPKNEGYYVTLREHDEYLPGTEGHFLQQRLAEPVTLAPGDTITVQKFDSSEYDPEYRPGNYTYELKSENCRGKKQHIKGIGMQTVKVCDLYFDFIKWEKEEPTKQQKIHLDGWECNTPTSWERIECEKTFE